MYADVPAGLDRRQRRMPALALLHGSERVPSGWLAGGAGDEGGDDVGGVAVEGDPGPVVAHGGAGVGVAGGFLHVAQRDPGVERGGDERVAQRVRSDPLGDPGAAGDPAHDPAGGVAVEPAAVGGEEDRSFAAFADGQVDGAGGAGRERDGDDLAALAQDGEGAVAAFEAERVRCRRRWLRRPAAR